MAHKTLETSDSKYLIYGLCDPITGFLKYVGQSSRGMAEPLSYLRPSVGTSSISINLNHGAKLLNGYSFKRVP